MGSFSSTVGTDRRRCAVKGWRQGHLRGGEKITRRPVLPPTRVAPDRWLLPQRAV